MKSSLCKTLPGVSCLSVDRGFVTRHRPARSRTSSYLRAGIFLFLFTFAISGGLSARGSVSWVSIPKDEPNGWYWAYDDEEPGPPFDSPQIPDLPAAPYSDYAIHDNTFANRLAPYNDEPFQFTMPDSFWYYGYWLEPGDMLYVSPDGWVSFDPAGDDGFSTPPSSTPPFPDPAAPNMVIAPLWADYDPTRTLGNVDNNRVYIYHDADLDLLKVEWFQIEGHSTGNVYTFLLQLHLGGQRMLTSYIDCGVVFSYHLIEFIYHDASSAWDADNAATGFECPDGEHGITYQGTIDTEGDDFHAVRGGFKKIYKNDVAAVGFLSPGSMVLRWTPIEPEVIVGNVGLETEHFTATLKIRNSLTLEEVYDYNLGSFNLAPGANDTLVAPCWTPEEIEYRYTLTLEVQLDRDSCQGNNTWSCFTSVGCDDTLKAVSGGSYAAYFYNDVQIGIFYEADDGILISGGRVSTPDTNFEGGPWMAALWQAEGGCGLPLDPPVATAVPIEIDTPWTSFSFGPDAVYVPSGNPGNIWGGVIPSSSVDPAKLGLGYSYSVSHTCYGGPGGSRASFREEGAWDWTAGSGFNTTPAIQLFSHLGFGSYPMPVKPSPPCYDEEPHDISIYRIQEPSIEYVEGGAPINPELALANLGRTAEPDSGFFTVKLHVVNVTNYINDTVYTDSSTITHIGWMGDPADDPDTVFVSFPPWTPADTCYDGEPLVYYELLGITRLGAVGPDLSDHCPYNDTLRKLVTCLLSHDVGARGITINPAPSQPPDWYDPNTTLEIGATVWNYGYNAEHDIPVRCEIVNHDSNILVWHNLQQVEFLDWRGNTFGRPYQSKVWFEDWVTPDQQHYTIECRSEMVGDECPDNDHTVRHINAGIAETGGVGNFALIGISPNPFSSVTTISFAIPRQVNVSLKVYDVSGKVAATLVSGPLHAGTHSVTWHGDDDAGKKLPAGIYLVRLEAGVRQVSQIFTATEKVVLY